MQQKLSKEEIDNKIKCLENSHRAILDVKKCLESATNLSWDIIESALSAKRYIHHLETTVMGELINATKEKESEDDKEKIS